MALKHNLLANYASQLYAAAIGILILPLYIRYMGAETYGLVGFFTMLQAWFALLDLGLTPTIARETARFYGGALSPISYRRLFRALSLIFTAIAIVGGGGLWLLADVVATQWLNVEELPHDEVVLAVQIMAISVALRWMGGLYRGVITGAERLVWLGGFNALIATLRFLAVLPVMWLFGFTPIVFFIHQFSVALMEVAGLLLMAFRLLPARSSLAAPIGFSFRPVTPVLRFALTIAFTSSVWVLVTQTDKLVLSGILPLAEYGYFTLAVLMASGVTLISSPISSVIMPRMARLHAEGKKEELINLYRRATQIVSAIAGSASITLILCAQQLVYAWTGDNGLSIHAAPILQLYAIGNGLLAVGAFPYYLQYAKGDLRYHFYGNATMVIFLIPSIVYAASSFGAKGAGYVWVGVNAFYLLGWVAYVHSKLVPKLHLNWLLRDVGVPVLFALVVGFVLTAFFPLHQTEGRLVGLALSFLFGGFSLLGSVTGLLCMQKKVF